MKRTSLTSKREWVGGKLAHVYVYGGEDVLVHDSARNILLAIELIGDAGVPDERKPALLREMLFAAPDELPDDGLLASVLWDAAGIDVNGSHAGETGGRDVFDWDFDAARIAASLRMAYGLDWDSASRELSFAEVCDLLGCLLEADGPRTPFAEAVYYRTAEPPKATKGNEEYARAWKKRRDHFRLPVHDMTAPQAASASAKLDAVMSALWEG